MGLLLLPALVVCNAAVAAIDDVRFTTPPTAARDGDAVRITFAVSAPTDVEVAVVDAKGKVVRHLAAGMLGGKEPPPPPLAPGLTQSISWDGKGDDGQAAKGRLTVRVRLGRSAKLDRVIGWSGQKIDAPRAMACGPDGTLYVLHGEKFYGHRETTLITAFTRDGRYLRQIMPGPGDLPPEKREGWPRVRLDDGAEVPVIHHVLTRSLYPGAYFGDGELGNMAVTGDGRLVVLSGCATTVGTLIKYADVRDGRRLLILGTDGSVPRNFLGPIVAGTRVGGKGYVAVSPDGRYAYVSGLGATDLWGKRKPAEIHHVVYRARLDGTEKASVFIGTLREAGAGKDGLNDPRGVAVGPDGNIYVADHGNQRIAVFKPGGEYLGEIPAEGATRIMVSRKTGAVYAKVGYGLVKYGGLSDPTKKAELALPTVNQDLARHQFCMAIDDSGEKPVLWLNALRWVNFRLVKVIDEGASLRPLGNPIVPDARDPGLPFVMNVAVLGDTLLTCTPSFPRASTTAARYSAVTGAYLGPFTLKSAKGEREKRDALFFCGSEYTAGKDGRLYTQTGGFMWPAKGSANPGTVRRYDEEGYPEPFKTLGKHFIHKYYHGHYRPAGMFVTREGRIHLAAFPGYRGRDQEEKGLNLYVIGPDGTVENERLVFVKGATVGGVAVDREGSIYVGVQVWPKGKRIPPWFEGKLPKSTRVGHPRRAYHQHGALVKFPPTGGRIVPDPEGPYMGHAGGYAKPAGKSPMPLRIENALWVRRLGYVPINDTSEAGCQCESTRFDVDEFGRLYVPDLYRFRVQVLDASGNDLGRFGRYGNMDSGVGRPGPRQPTPDNRQPSFGWPIAARYADGRVFVVDLTNRRIVAVTFDYAASATCAVPLAM